MKFLAYLIAAAGFVATPSTAHASDWWLATTNGEIFNFVDVSTIQKQGDSGRVAWGELHRFDRTYSALRMRYNCAEKSMTILNSTSYDKDGRVITTKDNPGNAFFAPPDTMGWVNISFVCEFAGANTPGNPTYGTQRLKPGMRPSQWVANLQAAAAEAVRDLSRNK